ncbi:MAG: DsbA family protein, partial [Gracilibacteraceae bacterium]|nr:DsbA family protein [Gracilibacteraceae bacterium]
EVFFDYICPHCLRGHEYLTELLPRYPGLEVEWRPCEAHPRPEQYGKHSDLCARGMYFALEHGADLAEYHRGMYDAALVKLADIEDIAVIAEIMSGLPEPRGLLAALSGRRYEDRLAENNRLAWETYGFPAVPSYRLGENTLESELGVGVSRESLAAFLDRYGR